MAEFPLERQCDVSSLNLLKPVEVVIKAMQQLIDAAICILEWAVNFLTSFGLPGGGFISPNGQSDRLKANFTDDFYNLLDFPRVILEYLLNAIGAIKTIIFKMLELPLALILKPLPFLVGLAVHKFNFFVTIIQPFVPITIPKLENPVGELDWPKFDFGQPITNFYNKIQPYVPSPLLYPIELIRNRIPGFRPRGKGITQIEKYNKELIDLIEKERQQHYKDLSKLTSLKDDESKVNEILAKDKREYDALKQELLDKISQEIEQHRQDVDELKKQSGKDKGVADETINRIKSECEKQKRELQEQIDRLLLGNKDDKLVYEEKLQKLDLDCKKLTQELQEKIETEQQKKAELEKIKGDVEKDKTSYFEKVAKERELHQKEIDDLIAQKRDEKVKADLQISQLTKDLATQKQSFLDQLENQRKDCAAQIDKIKNNSASGDSQTILLLKKTNQSLEEQKQDLTAKLTKEREQYLQDLSKADAKCRDEKAAADAKVELLTRDLNNQKQELLGELEKQRKLSEQQVQKALDDQKGKYERENADLRKDLEALKIKCAGLQNQGDKGIFGKINDTLSKPAGVADKVTKPLQETGFGKIFG